MSVSALSGQALVNHSCADTAVSKWMTVSKKQEVTKAGKAVDRGESLCPTVHHYGKQYEGPPSVKNRASHDPAIPLLGMYSKEMKPLCQGRYLQQ